MIDLLFRAHGAIYSASGGRLGTRFFGLRFLLLTTTGRRSGRHRAVALSYTTDSGRFVVIGSNGGEDRHPSWWLNLQAHPDASVRVASRTLRVRARRASGEERARLWAHAVASDPRYETYRRRTRREIPVVVLEPV